MTVIKKLKPQIHKLTGFTESEAKKFYQAALLCVETINMTEFHYRVAMFEWPGVGKKFKMTDKTNEQVYDHIMSGSDLFGWSDGDMDIDATIYFEADDTVGYTYATSIRTWINRKFFFRWAPPKISGNIAHEYMHLLGYMHSADWNETIIYTAPYGVGYIVADIAAEIYKPSKHSPKNLARKLVCRGYGPFKKCDYEVVAID